MRGNRLMRAVGEQIEDRAIESLQHLFGAVAVDLFTGREVWIQQGSMLGAVRASSGLPGLFTPTLHEGRWLIDGGVLNPVPVSLCRALGADYVIAVSLDRLPAESEEHQLVTDETSQSRRSEPGVLEVMQTTISIMQDQIIRGRMASDPPDLLIAPDLENFQLMDFYRASEAIELGYEAVASVAEQLERLG